jgi:hypothetical protein
MHHDIASPPLPRPTPLLCFGVLESSLDSSLEGLGVRADDLADLLLVLEEQEGGHGADAELLGDVGDLVDVDLVEARIGVGVGEPSRTSQWGW